MSFDLKRGMQAIVLYAEDPSMYFATAIYDSMKGAGTNDLALVRAIVSRAEVDMVEIKDAFVRKYSRSMADVIRVCRRRGEGVLQLLRVVVVVGRGVVWPSHHDLTPPLSPRYQSDCSGHYRDALLAIISEN